MVINEEQLQIGIVKFIDNVLAPKADIYALYTVLKAEQYVKENCKKN